MKDVAPASVAEHKGSLEQAGFEEIRRASQPVVMRGIVEDWPAIAAAREGDRTIADYLMREGALRPVGAIAAAPAENGRFFYTDGLERLNFVSGKGELASFLSDLLHAAKMDAPPAMAVQSEDIASLVPHFARENTLTLLPDVAPRIWIGNRIRVATHYDAKENVACCVAGRRKFTLFPPDQIANLYPGPFELTPAGTPVSLVDPENPDHSAYPRYVDAQKTAMEAVLDPGDALYIPYGWWHAVASLDPVSILVNYWWSPGQPDGIGGQYDGLLHAMLSFKHLPPDQREVWRTLLDYYVFEKQGSSAAHLPSSVKGVLGPPSPRLFERMRAIVRQALG